LLVGADDFLGEPFDRDELLARARHSLDRLSRQPATLFASGLSPREQQVLELLTHGLTQRQIAAALLISPKTAGTHVQHILSKLGVHSSAHAVAVAVSADTTGHKSPAAQRVSA
jgi:DNA-binding NarL/FixJ family response regulator